MFKSSLKITIVAPAPYIIILCRFIQMTNDVTQTLASRTESIEFVFV